MQSNLYVHTKCENIEEIYLYPIWEFFKTSNKIVIKAKLGERYRWQRQLRVYEEEKLC